MRRVDKLGRVVIPMELRKKYDLDEGVAIEFLDRGDGIAIKAYEPFCKICHTKLCDDRELPLCDACMAHAVEAYQEKR